MTQFLQATVNGVALAAIYALIALGFVIIYKSMQVLSFAQPALLLLGGYWVLYFSTVWGWAFPLAIAAGCALGALSGVVLERLTLRPMIGKPVFAVAIMTIGLNTVLTVVAGDLLGLQLRSMGDPWGIKSVALGSVFISHRQIAALVIVLIAFSALMLFFRFSRMGLAMQATSFDQEVALAQGVSVGAVFALSWAIAAALATLGGVFLGTPIGLSITASGSALKALPVVVIGGLDSFPGALVGALIVGLGETYVGTYQSQIPVLGSLGQGLAQLVPYLLMFIVLLVRPFGLFGTREVERV